MTQHPHSPAEGWPVDPDVTAEDLAERPSHHVIAARRLAVVLAGGFAGGLVRYETTTHWAASAGTFPWSTFTVNTAGAFLLGLIVIIVLDVLGPSTYTQPLIGAGFCGALTTFSSVVVQVDQLIAHGHAGLGFGYLAASVAVGLPAVALGAFAARLVPATPARRAIDEGAA
jgi:CrcB protein